jgi:phosphotransferase system IIA component
LLFTQLESQGENVATGDKVLEARKQYLKDKKSSVEEFKRQIAHKRWISF